MKRIEKKKYKVTDENHYKSVTVKAQIILSFSMRKGNFHINRLQHKEVGKCKKWNAFTVTREGKIHQHFDPKHYTDFMGVKSVDKKSIVVVLENMGSLLKDGNEYVNWLDENCDNDRVVEKKWLGQKYWELIGEEQLNSVVDLCKRICKEHEIPTKVIEFPQHHKDIEKFNGIVMESNYHDDGKRYNPLFDLIKFNELMSE